MSKSHDIKVATRGFTNRKPVDGDKLRALYKTVGSTRQVGDKVGYNQSTVSNWCTEGEISMPGMKALELAFGWTYDMYAPENETVAEVKEEPVVPQSAIDYDKLYDVIYRATYEAVKRAWSE